MGNTSNRVCQLLPVATHHLNESKSQGSSTSNDLLEIHRHGHMPGPEHFERHGGGLWVEILSAMPMVVRIGTGSKDDGLEYIQ